MTDEQRSRLSWLVGTSLGFRIEPLQHGIKTVGRGYVRLVFPGGRTTVCPQESGGLPWSWPNLVGDLAVAWAYIVPAATTRGWIVTTLAWLRDEDKTTWMIAEIRSEETDGPEGIGSGLVTDAAECLCRAWLAACGVEARVEEEHHE